MCLFVDMIGVIGVFIFLLVLLVRRARAALFSLMFVSYRENNTGSWESAPHRRSWDLADPCFDLLEVVFWVAGVKGKSGLGRRLWAQLRVHERRWVSERERSVMVYLGISRGSHGE